MKQTNSLANYLKHTILLPFCIFMMLLGTLATAFYWFALDDTAEFYLFDDAYLYLASGQTINTGARYVSNQLQDMPPSLQGSFSALHTLNQVEYLSSQHHDNYILKYREAENAPIIYVAHQFDKTDSVDIRPILLFVCVLSVAFFASWLTFVVRKIRSQMTHFVQNINTQSAAHPIQFDELSYAQKRTLNALANEHNAIAREKAFSNFLSHEIRHPLTLLGHQLAQFDHFDNLTEQTFNQIETLKHTQKKTVTLANTILNIWQNDDAQMPSTLDAIAAITEWQKSASYKVSIHCTVSQFLLSLSDAQFALLMAQVDSNFQKYGLTELSIVITQSSIEFSNQINPTPNALQSYGVGTFIISALAKKAGLGVNQHTQQNRYTLCLCR